MATESELLLMMANDPEYAQATRDHIARQLVMRQAMARQAAVSDRAAEAARQRRISPTKIHVPLPGEEVKYEAPGIFGNPNSWFNRGLYNLAGNAYDVIMGEESGNPAVDYGLANVPGVGAAGILAAGGVPGMVDVAGAGSVKNVMKGIKMWMKNPKLMNKLVSAGTRDPGIMRIFQTERRGEDLRRGLSKAAEHFKPIKSRFGYNPLLDYSDAEAYDVFKTLLDEGDPDASIEALQFLHDKIDVKDFSRAADDFNEYIKRANKFAKKPDKVAAEALAEGKTVEEWLGKPEWVPEYDQHVARALDNMKPKDVPAPVQEVKPSAQEVPTGPSPEAIAAREREIAERKEREAQKKAEKEARAADRAEQKRLEELARQERVRLAEERRMAREAEVAARAATPEPSETQQVLEAVAAQKPEVPVGGPNKWRENGWTGPDDSFYEKFGANLEPESKRDAFVMDSLANHWIKNLYLRGKAGNFKDAEIHSTFDKKAARHQRTNYDQVAERFLDDVSRNLESGNMPGTAVQILQRYAGNRPVEGKTAPTLVLKTSEKPKLYDNPWIWPDDAEGIDLYQLLFKRRADQIFKQANPEYW